MYIYVVPVCIAYMCVCVCVYMSYLLVSPSRLERRSCSAPAAASTSTRTDLWCRSDAHAWSLEHGGTGPYGTTAPSARRHQIESPKRPTKNSTRGRLPHNNNVSTIECLGTQMVVGTRPYGSKQPRSARGAAALLACGPTKKPTGRLEGPRSMHRLRSACMLVKLQHQ
jgi:hypothetical protein